jgi:hypothetical protein
MKRILLTGLAVLCLVPLALGDCCKIPIPPCNPQPIPEPPPPKPNEVQPMTPDKPDGPDEPGPGEVPTPCADVATIKKTSDTLGGYFKEPQQQAVIGWNGKEEVLILTTNEQSLVKTGAMLSVLPLPGKPIKITRANTDAFKKAKALIRKKLDLGLGGNTLGVIMTTKIGPHNIFVWEIGSTGELTERVNAYILATYKGRAKALITDEINAVLKNYLDRGFRYFAFDLVSMDGEQPATKTAISYHFSSKFLYYPMVVSKAGGVGESFVNLVAFTPGTGLNRFKGLELTRDDFLMKKSVPVTAAELADIDPTLGSIFGGATNLLGRDIRLKGTLKSLAERGDLQAWYATN